jgi:CMP-N-acetylneuraminic acid synthetase
MSEILGLIPARGGSKAIPGKNIVQVAGMPLVWWTIQAAQQAEGLSRIAVTTDSEEIANIVTQFGLEVPFLRPAELAQDTAPTMLAILHAIRWYEEYEAYCPDLVMCLQPTSPLRIAEDIDSAIALALDKGTSVVSVTPVHRHPYWMKQVDAEGRATDFVTVDRPIHRRQDLPTVYAPNGAIYLARREILLQRETFYTENTHAYVMPPQRSLDIDTPWDLYLADLILKDRIANGKC